MVFLSKMANQIFFFLEKERKKEKILASGR
jgi:hypothetical protein